MQNCHIIAKTLVRRKEWILGEIKVHSWWSENKENKNEQKNIIKTRCPFCRKNEQNSRRKKYRMYVKRYRDKEVNKKIVSLNIFGRAMETLYRNLEQQETLKNYYLWDCQNRHRLAFATSHMEDKKTYIRQYNNCRKIHRNGRNAVNDLNRNITFNPW